MVHKIARKCRHVARLGVHELWVSLEISGALWFPVGNMAGALQAIRQGDATWRAAHAHAEDMRDLRAMRRAAGGDSSKGD